MSDKTFHISIYPIMSALYIRRWITILCSFSYGNFFSLELAIFLINWCIISTYLNDIIYKFSEMTRCSFKKYLCVDIVMSAMLLVITISIAKKKTRVATNKYTCEYWRQTWHMHGSHWHLSTFLNSYITHQSIHIYNPKTWNERLVDWLFKLHFHSKPISSADWKAYLLSA